MALIHEEADEEIEIEFEATPKRYVPLSDLYSATAPCITATRSSNVKSKKIKARKLHRGHHFHCEKPPTHSKKPPLLHCYSRRRPKNHLHSLQEPSFFDSLASRSQPQSNVSPALEIVEEDGPLVEKKDEDCGLGSMKKNNDKKKLRKKKKRKREFGGSDVVKLGADSSSLNQLDEPRVGESLNQNCDVNNADISRKRKRRRASGNCENPDDSQMGNSAKKWVRLSFDGVDLKKFIGLKCKVYWPLDGYWYSGHVVGFNAETDRHHVSYEDGEEEYILLSKERVKFYISRDEMQQLNLSYRTKTSEMDDLDFSEMVALAASFDDSHELGPGDIIWAKLTGHAMWPAIIVDESLIVNLKGLNRNSGVKSVPVQFFGTHDFARINMKQVIPFLRGLLSSFHLKCKKSHFVQSLEEAKMYLSEQKLPKRMLKMQNAVEADDCASGSREDEKGADSGEDCRGDERIHSNLEGTKTCPFEIGDLQVISLGKIVKDSEYFQDGRFIWPEGYTAVRKFPSIADPNVYTLYKMEVLKCNDAGPKTRPLFRVTLDNGKQFKGSTPSSCWNKIYKRIRKTQCSSDGFIAEGGLGRIFNSGCDMFGFSNPEISKLIQELSNSKLPSKSSMSKLSSRRLQDVPNDYRPVHIKWKDLDKCNVCHMDEEYDNNLFLQCDKCRMMVHAKCYGELEPVDGVLWLCSLCRPGAPDSPPPCCLCPVVGGAMKPTLDGRWAHLACAIWIPETCLSDVKKMEPIDGISRIAKDRWKLLCSICRVSYGACIQCSNNTCCVAYHPLCARAAGFCVELESEDRLNLMCMDEDEDEDAQCIRMLSFCKKHRSPSSELLTADDCIVPVACQYSEYSPLVNPSGCARSEPYNCIGRRGRKEPEVLAAASLKRLFVEQRPYLVGGYCRHEALGNTLPSTADAGSKFSLSLQELKTSELDAPESILSMAEKYKYMRKTYRKRLTFGKSGIHGFGIFAKQPHRAGDMVIEYIGEIVRPSVADRRERFMYNSLVGAGTYMFRIDDERVIDATRAGSIAHLINHSCEPNCYSRVINANGDDHIIIFAKRDVKQWEELTYDYRFFSIDEHLACCCGFPRCRGVVNDIVAEGQVAKLHVPHKDLIHWKG
ncbi:hypothetical protein CsSME_00020108 [Camellia sinensis var. sinensis]